MILSAVFASSAATLAFEVLLTRLFAITQWHHLSFMVISVAMLGSAGGGVLSRTAAARRAGLDRLIRLGLGLLPLVLLAAFGVSAGTRLDYFQLALSPLQLGRLGLLFVALACPFAVAGLITAPAFSRAAPGRVYLASMAGAAAGALLPAVLLPAVGLTRAFVLAALLPSPAALAWARDARRAALVLAVAPIAIAAPLLAFPALADVQPNQYKALRHIAVVPGVGSSGRTERLRARYDELSGAPVRFAPGLSLRYVDALPAQRLILEDGDRSHVLVEIGDPRSGPFARSLLTWAATLVPPRLDRVLVLHADGGNSVVVATAAGAGAIDLVTDQAHLAARFAAHYGSRLRNVAQAPPRAFLEAPGETYDLIQVESRGPQLPAMASLVEDHLLTVEALRAMLARLAQGGALVFDRALDLPPNDLLRLLATAWQALGVPEPERHTAVLRSWDSLLVIVVPGALDEPTRDRLRAFAERMRFDLVQLAGLTAAEANRFNQMARPWHFEAAAALAAGRTDPRSPFDVSALTDARPFPYHFVRWSRLPAAWRLLGDRLYSLMLSGEVMLVLLLVTAAAASVLILVLPVGLPHGGWKKRSGPAAPVPLTAFVAIGAAYMLAEIAWLQALGLLLGSPSLAFAVGVGGLLLASGPGGLIAERSERLGASLAAAAAAALALSVLYAVAAKRLLPLPPVPRAAAALAALLPCGLLMGIPFPLGLRRLLRGAEGPHEGRDRLARAWAANGASSVVASVAAPVVAMSLGTAALFAAAGACYALALAAGGSRSGTIPWASTSPASTPGPKRVSTAGPRTQPGSIRGARGP